MKKIYLSVLLFLSFSGTLSAQQYKLDEKKTATLHAEERNLDYTLYIQLPKNYGKLTTGYPVILLFDAQDKTLFNYTSSAIDRLMYTNDIPEAIFIGIVQKDRSKELSIEQNEPSAIQFLNFIKNDLTAYLKKTYQVNEYYTLIGHSLGGQFVTNAMLTYPDTFKSVICISGALNYPASVSTYKKKVLNKLENFLSTKTTHLSKQKYYFSVGDEGFQDSGFRLGALTADSLLTKYKTKILSYHFDELKGFNHMTTPLISVPAGLVFIFKDWNFSENLAMDILLTHRTDPVEAVKNKKELIINAYGNEIALPYNVYEQLSSYCLSKGDADKAKLLTTQMITSYPDRDAGYALMAEIFIKQGDLKSALAYLKIAQTKSTTEKYQEKITKLSDQLITK